MLTELPAVEEPLLTIRRGVAGTPQRGRFSVLLPSVALVAALMVIVLLVSGHAALPFARVVTVEAMVASKSEFFGDPQVERLLLRHGLRMHLTTRGSWDFARQNLAGQDLVFPSDAAPANFVLDRLGVQGRSTSTYKPFTTPLVLASFREFAEALHGAGVAAPVPGPDGGRPFYYRLDMAPFLGLVEKRRRWRDIGMVDGGNRITVFTPRICLANSAATYMALVAFVRNGDDVPQTAPEARALAERIKPLVTVFGQASEDLLIRYKTPQGRGAPIVSVYESEFLAYQLEHRDQTGRLDDERVLLYPSVSVQTEPVLIPLTTVGERVGRLLTTDPDLRRRATELGFRLISRDTAPTTDQLSAFLRGRGVPPPPTDRDGGTTMLLPRQDLFEEMIAITGDCP